MLVSVVENILIKCKAVGVDILLDNDRLLLKVPEDQEVDQELMAQVKANHKEIKEFLKNRSDRPAQHTGRKKIQKHDRLPGDKIPLTFSQERLWFIHKFGGSRQYHLYWAFRLKGILDQELLETAFREVLRRHEPLRTIIQEENGEGYQVVREATEWKIEEASAIEEIITRPFDIAHDYMLRVCLLRQSVTEHLLVVVLHHIASDGWSVGVLIRELSALYGSLLEGKPASLAPLPLQYADYAIWQRQYLSGDSLGESLLYWKQKLAGVAPLELPLDYTRPSEQSVRGGMVKGMVPAAVYTALQQLSRQKGLSLFMTMLGVFKILLYRYSGQPDISVGVPVAGRYEEGLESLIGFFVNTVVLRSKLEGSMSLEDLLEEVRSGTLEAYEHQEVPFEKIVEVLGVERDRSRNPLFQVMFSLEHASENGELRLGDVAISEEPFEQLTSQFDLSVQVTESGGALQLAFTYCSDLYKEETVRRMVDHYLVLLQSAVGDTTEKIGRLRMLSEAEEYRLVRGFNDTAVSYPDKTVITLFGEQVRLRGDAPAVVFRDQTISYRELDERSNQLAHYLRGMGVKGEMLIPICVERSVEMITGVLGIMKAGGAYVPLDPDYPQERLHYMLRDIGAKILVCHSQFRDRFTAAANDPILVEIDTVQLPAASGQDRLEPGMPAIHDLAYVIYTSGSTGNPKGVMIEHRSLTNFLLFMQKKISIRQEESMLALTTYIFDISCLELYLPLISGATIVLADKEEARDARRLQALLAHRRPAYMQATPTTWQMLLDNDWRNESQIKILTGGEPLTEKLKDGLLKLSQYPLINLYGPTETTIWSTWREIRAGEKVKIGRPIDNTAVYILNKELQPCPVNVTGELYIGGAGVARGYLNRTELTSERFVKDIFLQAANARMYKTGDLCRWSSDGNIEFVGRADDQLKIRGYRIEPAEIESVLEAGGLISQAVVTAVEDTHGYKRLVAYVTVLPGFEPDKVLAYAKERLPQYMIPAQLVRLEEFPLTANGKINRRALPQPDSLAGQQEHVPARTGIEEALVRIWQQFLKVEPIGVYNDFFRLGGHSLLAIRVLSMIKKQLGVELSVKDVFHFPTIAALAQRIAGSNNNALPGIEKIHPRPAYIPLSYAQERLWFIDKLQGTLQYNLSYVFRLSGRLDREALQQAFRAIVDRHEVLRTVIREEDGKGYQQVMSCEGWQLEYRSMVEEGIVAAVIARPFDLSHDYMLRVTVVKLSEEEHLVTGVIHHIASDGWSVGILAMELTALYKHIQEGWPLTLPPLPVQYADYAGWQRQYIAGELLDEKLQYWQRKLAGAESLELPTDYVRPAEQSIRGATVKDQVDREVHEALQQLSQRQGVTLFMTLLSAFKVLLYRYSGQQDISVGVPVAGRQHQELEGLIGFFVNTLVLRSELSGSETFAELLRSVKQTTLEAYDHQDVPFEKVVEALGVQRDMSRNPLFQVMFALQNAPDNGPLELGGLILTEEPQEVVTSQFDISVQVVASAEGLRFSITYNCDLYRESTIRGMVEHYRQILRSVANDPAIPIGKIRMLGTEEENNLLTVFCNQPAKKEDASMLTVFPLQKLLRDRWNERNTITAIRYKDKSISYKEVGQAIAALVNHLYTRYGLKKGDRVAVLAHRTDKLITTVLCLLEHGWVYVPIDATYPAGRIAFLLQDAQPDLVIGEPEFESLITGHGSRFMDIHTPLSLSRHIHDFAAPIDPADEAYIIYTSGSSGRPKGVIITHAGLNQFFCNVFTRYGTESEVVVPFLASHSFDISLFQLLLPFLWHGTLIIAENTHLQQLDELTTLLEACTVIDTVPAVYQVLVNHISEQGWQARFSKITRVFIGGDYIRPGLLQQLAGVFTNAAITVTYGPTEGTIFCTQITYEPGAVTAAEQGDSIGRPLWGSEVYILDENQALLPTGVPGEIYLGGPNVGKTYLNLHELNAEKFVDHPLGRLYRTGDRGKWQESGGITFLGRTDDQVKVRGYRIEPGEIEKVCEEYAGIRQAVVLATPDPNGHQQLVAFIVAPAGWDKEGLLHYLGTRLPGYMIPSKLFLLEQLPLNPNGKINRKQLLQIAADGQDTQHRFMAPRNAFESAMAEIWCALLNIEQIGINDNFFELGGDSIISIQLISRARRKGYVLHPRDIFRYQTIAALSRHYSPASSEQDIAGEQGELTGASGLLPAQRWYLEQHAAQVPGFSQQALLAIDKRITGKAVEEAIEQLLITHDALRFCYREGADGWIQTYRSREEMIRKVFAEETVPINTTSLQPVVDHCIHHYRRQINIYEGELVRAVLISTGNSDPANRLLLIIHHLAVDAVSWRILIQDLDDHLANSLLEQPYTPPLKSSSCRQWYTALQGWANDGLLQSDYWQDSIKNKQNKPGIQSYKWQRLETRLGVDLTSQLLQRANQAYHTDVSDLLLAALGKALRRQHDNDTILIGMEGHGRWGQTMNGPDTSRTVGWLTALFPLLLSIKPDMEEVTLLKEVKEQVRRVPGKGIGYGVLKYITQAEGLQGPDPWIVVFNYIGQTDSGMDTLQCLSKAPESTSEEIGPEPGQLVVNVAIENGELLIEWKYNSTVYSTEEWAGISSQFATCLERLIGHCVSRYGKTGEPTPSDFGLQKEIHYSELDAFLLEQKEGRGGEIQSICRLSALQEGMLFHALYTPEGVAYVDQMSCDLFGVDVEIFTKSWNCLVQRHSTLRTGFYHDRFSLPVQCVRATATMPVTLLDYRGMGESDQELKIHLYEEQDRQKGFDYSVPPLMRVSLLQLDKTRYRMVWTHHHLVMDGWSFPVLIEELLRVYDQLLKEEELEPVQEDRFEDFIHYLEARPVEADKPYWQKYLAKLETGTLLPFIPALADRNKASGNYEELVLTIDQEATACLTRFVQTHRLTVNTVMQGVWAYLLSRYSGSQDIVFGITVSGRPEALPAIESRVGMYINTLPLYVQASPGQDVLDWLQSIAQDQQQCLEFQHTALSDIKKWTGIEGELFDSLLVFENYPVSRMLAEKGHRLEFGNIKTYERTNYPLCITISPDIETRISFIYNAMLFEQQDIQQISGHFQHVLQQVIREEVTKLSTISLLTPFEEHRLLVTFNNTRIDLPQDKTVIDLIEEQARRTPQAIALEWEEGNMTFRELNERSNQLAHYLQQRGVSEESMVPVCLHRSPEMMVAILGILKAGGAYVPIDPDYPGDRIGFILADTAAGLVVTVADQMEKIPEEVTAITLDEQWQEISSLPASMPPRCTTNAHLCYVIYTSGSTGRPKGVMIEHGGLLNRLLWTQQYFQLTAEDVVLQKTTYCFDVSVWELLWPLMAGAKLVLAKPGGQRDHQYLKDIIEQAGITLLHFVPSALEAFLNDIEEPGCDSIKKVLCSGEALLKRQVELLQKKLPHVELYNLYGPTEASIDVTCWQVPVDSGGSLQVSIGKPIYNTSLYVLDKEGAVCPIGVPGELHIGGVQLARGYLNLPELTAIAFIDNPFEATGQSRLYRTGDLCRWLPDGVIEYLGRRDDQVKVRGYRIEPGEVARVIEQSGLVKQAAVIAAEAGDGSRQLVGYVVGTEGFSAGSVMSYLRSRLPEYMIPARLIPLDRLPLNSNGKLNRRALPSAVLVQEEGLEYVAPRNDREQTLSLIWCRLLGLSQVSVTDNFFTLGGHSLLATRLASAIRKEWQVQIAVKDLFVRSTVAEQADWILVQMNNEIQELPIGTLPVPSLAPLSYSQERLWFIDQLHGSVQYHIPYVFEVHGELDVVSFERSFRTLIHRHAVLRTVIREEGGRGYQQVLEEVDWSVDHVSCRELDEQALAGCIEEQITRPFDLSVDVKLRVWLLERADSHVIVVVLHHIASDGWSLGLLVEEFTHLYNRYHSGESISLPAVSVSYRDYALWERSYVSGPRLERKLAYWKEQLRDISPLELPADYSRGRLHRIEAGVEHRFWDTGLREQLESLASRQGATLYMLLLSVFKVLLHRYTGQEVLCVGSPVAGRYRSEMEKIIGCFVNTLVLRSEVRGGMRFTELLDQVKETTLAAYEHQEVPFEKLVEVLGLERDMSRHPLYDVKFQLANLPVAEELVLAGLEVSGLRSVASRAQMDLSVDITPVASGLHVSVTYSSSLYKAARMRRLLDHYEQLLRSVIINADKTVGELALLTTTEEAQLEAFSGNKARVPLATQNVQGPQSILEVFSRQVLQIPLSIAVASGRRQLSYGALEEESNRLARYLRHKGVGPDVAVGICCGREPEMVIGILGILKAGGGYVPLDPDYPSERLSYMLSDSGSQLVLTHSACTEVLQQLSTDYELIELDGPMATYRQCSAQEIDHRVGPSDLAYVIYTSGSTGRPKGVCIEHGTLLRSTQARIAYYNITPSIFQVPSFSFDSSVAVLFWALLTGGRVLLSKTEELKDADYIGRVLQQSDTLLCVPSYYRFVLSEGLLIGAGLKQVILAGESVEPALVADHYRASAGVKLYNEYGPTEGTVWSTVCELKAGEEVITIGRPVEGVSVYLLDDSGRPAPIGISGELYIGGLQLARGYLNQPELTKEKFIDHKGERLYRTGDRGHWDQEGRIVFEGRRDDQVKLRGYRIELSEIGRLLEEHEAVQQAVALVVEAEGGHKQLMGFVACGVKEGREAEVATVSSEALRSWLLARLPEYMVPVRILTGEALPLTPNGKIDKQVLLQWSLPENTENGTGYEGPRNDFESAMVSIWSEVLGVERVGIHDNFFELGGDSIISIQVVSRARRLGYVFEVADLFSYQAISRLPVSQQAAPAQQQPAAEGIANLLPIQHWYFDQSGAGEVPFNQGVLVGLDKQIGEQELTQVLNLVLGHHDALRMRYNKMESGWQQSYQPVEAVAAHVYEEDLRGYSGEDFLNELKRLSEQYQGAPSIQRGDLVRMVLFRTGEEYTHNRLLLIIHHLVVDGVSWRILLEDMEYALEAVLEGRSVSLPAVGSSYGDWSAALSTYGRSVRVQNQLAYWEGVQKAYKPVKTDHTKDNGPVTGERRSYGVRLPQQLTRRLLQESHRSYHTEINDLLLSALGRVVGGWSGLEEVLVGLEGHGRWPELVGGGVDISRTVGWFTSIYPLRLSGGAGLDTGAHIKNVKEQLRGIPDKGLGYGVLKYLEHATSLQGREGWDIVFNYLGQSDNVVKSSRWFSGAGEDAGSGEGAGWKSEVLLSVNSIVMGGELLIRWGYNSQWYEESTIRELAEGYLLELENIIEHCGSRQEVEHTPSDYGLGKEISYAELDEFMEEREGGIKRRVLVDSLYRLSSLQEGLLFHGLYGKEMGTYMVSFMCDFINPEINYIKQCWDHLLSRHSILRSSFYHDRFRIPVQCVYRKVRMPVVELDYRDQADQPGAVSLYEYTDRMRGFVFSEGPLMRVSLLRLSEDRYRMVWTHHHLVLDGWSCAVLMEEFLQLYDQLVKGKPVPAVVEDRYEDYIRYTEQRSKEEEEAYWRGYLQGLDAGTLLPFIDNPTERNQGKGRYEKEILNIDPDLTTAINDYARMHRLTVNTVMQGVWSYLLYRYTGNPQVVYGVTVSGRPEDLAGVEQRVGMYINTLPLYTQIVEDSDIIAWLQNVQKGQIDSREYQFSSLSEIKQYAGINGEWFDSILVFENYPVSSRVSDYNGILQVENISTIDQTNYPLWLTINNGSEIQIAFTYNSHLVDAYYVKQMSGHVEHLLRQMVEAGGRKVGDLELFTPAEQSHLLKEFTGTGKPFPEKTIVALFDEQVERTPHAIAVTQEGQALTYKELQERANRLAAYLVETYDIGPDALVMICLERSVHMLIAILGVLKAGAAYVPVEPGNPQERIKYIVSDTGTKVILTDEPTAGYLKPILHGSQAMLEYIDSSLLTAEYNGQAPGCTVKQEHLAYVIYTSGTTGQPKGVMISHRSLADYCEAILEKTNIKECRTFGLTSTIAADLGNTVLFPALITGGLLQVFSASDVMDPEKMYAANLDCIKIVPSHWRALQAEKGLFIPNKCLIFGGEPLAADIISRLEKEKATCKVYNHYGPTETTIGKLAHPIAITGEKVKITLGRPIGHTQVYILNGKHQLMPPGTIGELCIAGNGLARGYLNRPDLTAEKFVPNPFKAGDLMYKTGDLARWLPDGTIQFIGRNDFQVKIRGYRVEPGEVESVLQQCPLVKQAVVMANNTQQQDARLIAYIIPGERFDKESITGYLQARLPGYMVPDLFVEMETFKLLQNGKVDKRSLPVPGDIGLGYNYVAPQTPAEQTLVTLWADFLKAEKIGIEDDFFELGGNSLIAIRVRSAIRKTYKIDIPIQVLFQFRTIRKLAKYIELFVAAEAGSKTEQAEFEVFNI